LRTACDINSRLGVLRLITDQGIKGHALLGSAKNRLPATRQALNPPEADAVFSASSSEKGTQSVVRCPNFHGRPHLPARYVMARDSICPPAGNASSCPTPAIMIICLSARAARYSDSLIAGGNLLIGCAMHEQDRKIKTADLEQRVEALAQQPVDWDHRIREASHICHRREGALQDNPAGRPAAQGQFHRHRATQRVLVEHDARGLDALDSYQMVSRSAASFN
jgi:hypothetical protein